MHTIRALVNIDWLHSVVVPLLLARSAALEAGSTDIAAIGPVGSEGDASVDRDHILRKYAGVLAGGAPVSTPDDTVAFSAEFGNADGSELVTTFISKFLTYAQRVNMLFKAGKWQTSFKTTIILLLGTIIKHIGASDAAKEWALAGDASEPPKILATAFVQAITTHNKLFQDQRHQGDQETFFEGISSRLKFLLFEIQAAKEAVPDDVVVTGIAIAPELRFRTLARPTSAAKSDQRINGNTPA
jgi:hypothetical protein